MSQQIRNSSSLSTRALLMAVAVLALSPTWAIAHEPAKTDGKPMSAGSMHHSKMDGMKHMDGMSMTGDADYDFAVNMKKHHEMALTMAQAEIKNGKNAEMIKMANDITAAQKKEIASFDQWLAANKKAMPDTMSNSK